MVNDRRQNGQLFRRPGHGSCALTNPIEKRVGGGGLTASRATVMTGKTMTRSFSTFWRNHGEAFVCAGIGFVTTALALLGGNQLFA